MMDSAINKNIRYEVHVKEKRVKKCEEFFKQLGHLTLMNKDGLIIDLYKSEMEGERMVSGLHLVC